MELDRPHHRPSQSTSGELFICFTSRLSSSSSMKIAKSILSPGRARDPPISLSTSLSRRLRTNGSIKGGQASPMFPTGGKKRGCAFENPEPSSPKVTCIGQVRVKTKKKVKQTRSLSRRRSGEVSFRKVEQLSHDELKGNNEESVCAARTQQRGAATPANSSSHFEQQECLQQRNQRWVHLPVTICEALRAFGAEFSCLFPCRSSCFSTSERVKDEKPHGHGVDREEGNNGQSSCGAIFARWFVALQDCEGGKGREIELVVGGDEERTEVRERISMRSSRRHVFEDFDFKEETFEVKGEEGEEEEKARVSICIPPKNALLLMRCRSDPMKMAALTNRFWESPAPKDEDQDEEDSKEEEENDEENKAMEKELCGQHTAHIVNEAAGIDGEEVDEVVEQFVSAESNEEEAENQEKDANLANEVQEFVQEEPEEKLDCSEELKESEGVQTLLVIGESSECHVHLDQEMPENIEENIIQEQVQQEDEEENSTSQIDYSFSSAEISDTNDAESETEKQVLESVDVEEAAALEEENQEKTETSTLDEEEEEIPQETSLEKNQENHPTNKTLLISELEGPENVYDEEKIKQTEETCQEKSKEELQEEGENEVKSEIETKDDKENSSSNVLPDCLLLMMCEPKLSMEVSKETWVCSTDFLRWLPERPIKKKVNVNVADEPKKKKSVSSIWSTESSNPPPPGPLPPPPQEIMTQQQKQEAVLPPRSSCSAAAAVSMAAMIEQKLVDAVGYEPFVLTRCKSEPMRTAAAKLMPEACFWKNRKLEPHRNATVGVGAAGVGF